MPNEKRPGLLYKLQQLRRVNVKKKFLIRFRLSRFEIRDQFEIGKNNPGITKYIHVNLLKFKVLSDIKLRGLFSSVKL